jgi:hypothetical protein
MVLLHYTKHEEARVDDQGCSNEVSVDRVPVRAPASLDLQQDSVRFVHSINGVTNSRYALLTKEHRQRDPIRDASSGLDPVAQPLKPRPQDCKHAIAAEPTHSRGINPRLSLGYLRYKVWDPCGRRIALRVVSPLRIATHMDYLICCHDGRVRKPRGLMRSRSVSLTDEWGPDYPPTPDKTAATSSPARTPSSPDDEPGARTERARPLRTIPTPGQTRSRKIVAAAPLAAKGSRLTAIAPQRPQSRWTTRPTCVRSRSLSTVCAPARLASASWLRAHAPTAGLGARSGSHSACLVRQPARVHREDSRLATISPGFADHCLDRATW